MISRGLLRGMAISGQVIMRRDYLNLGSIVYFVATSFLFSSNNVL